MKRKRHFSPTTSSGRFACSRRNRCTNKIYRVSSGPPQAVTPHPGAPPPRGARGFPFGTQFNRLTAGRIPGGLRECLSERFWFGKIGRAAVLSVLLLFAFGSGRSAGVLAPASETYDLVIANGRVMDPESGLDGVRNVGIRGGKVAAISEKPLTGNATIDAKGLVVAPGFIDLHEHGQEPRNYQFQAHDGVTTSLELEAGTDDVDRWYAAREGKALINFGVSIGHIPVRMKVHARPRAFAADRRCCAPPSDSGRTRRNDRDDGAWISPRRARRRHGRELYGGGVARGNRGNVPRGGEVSRFGARAPALCGNKRADHGTRRARRGRRCCRRDRSAAARRAHHQHGIEVHAGL